MMDYKNYHPTSPVVLKKTDYHPTSPVVLKKTELPNLAFIAAEALKLIIIYAICFGTFALLAFSEPPTSLKGEGVISCPPHP